MRLSHLYKRVCPSVGPLVGPLVGPSVSPLVGPSRVFFYGGKRANYE